jgi:21S rRNA (GM2251-2'-O)-methyltransferase
MLNLVRSRTGRNLPSRSIALHRCYHVGKAGVVHTAIQRSLRKSKGQGLRASTKRALSANDPREKYRVQHGLPKWVDPPRDRSPRDDYDYGLEKNSPTKRAGGSMNGWGERGKTSTRDFEKRSLREQTTEPWMGRGKRTNKSTLNFEKKPARQWEMRGKTDTSDLRIRLGKRLITGKETEDGGRAERPARSAGPHEDSVFRYSDRRERDSDNGSRPFRARNHEYERPARSGRSYEERNSKHFGRRERDLDDIPRQSRGMKEPSETTRDNQGRNSGRDSGSPSPRSWERPSDDRSYGSRSRDRPSEPTGGDLYPSLSFKRGSSGSKFGNASSADGRPSERPARQGDPEPFDRSAKYGSKFPSANVPRDERSSSNGPKFTQVADNRIPLSIPYTTPASEFLYGTSVVESALRSRGEPRRQLYKLYIYTGENRKDLDQDARLEILAKRNSVEVVRVGNEWLRVMDKMSGGRPHNGYILEASPLPRLPVTGLGQLMTVDGQDGFEVSIGYQSREEAAVNGTSNFVKIQRNRHGRKPLVLLLDSIVDPGNLGGILRTAAFLGVTAIAISARNSASFTPVVLKASAGASEDVTLFMVNQPAGFIVDSKNAGWKVFAAVAPAKKHDPAMPASISTEQLDDPLSEDPCILMLGSEGEGLRWNLRTKADVNLYIEGSRQSHNVDSLNVSVAAGILCSSFLKRRKPKEAALIQQEQKADKKVPETVKLF